MQITTYAALMLCVVTACALEAPRDSSLGIALSSITVESPAALPPCNNGRAGEVYFSASDSTLYACVSGQWRPIPSGPPGPQGVQGPQGNRGATSLVRLTPEPAGTNCATGGQRIDVGVDTDDSGTLELSESQQTAYVCNGAANTCNPEECVHPPANTCEGSTLISYVSPGTCVEGSCSYISIQTVCAGGCEDGACLEPLMCDMGSADCDQSAANGCEIDLTTDSRNCGVCGNNCPLAANAEVHCSESACRLRVCRGGYADCDSLLANGCEISYLSDVRHCGGCGRACSLLPNALPGCDAGTCRVAVCLGDFADCDRAPQNGCESSILNDPRNCGACGSVCPSGATCSNGACVM